MKPLSAIALASAFTTCAPLWALDFDLGGNFTKDNDIQQFCFVVSDTKPVTLFTSSWNDGGFDPILTLWAEAGNKLFELDDIDVDGSQVSNGTAYNYGVWDSFFTLDLAPGTYTATLGQFDNFSNSDQLSDGFTYDGQPHFTFDQGFGDQPDFNGVFPPGPDPRTSQYLVHILNVDAMCPDTGSSVMLLAAGLAGLGAFTRARRSH